RPLSSPQSHRTFPTLYAPPTQKRCHFAISFAMFFPTPLFCERTEFATNSIRRTSGQPHQSSPQFSICPALPSHQRCPVSPAVSFITSSCHLEPETQSSELSPRSLLNANPSTLTAHSS